MSDTPDYLTFRGNEYVLAGKPKDPNPEALEVVSVDDLDAFGREHGIAALLDHLGLDGLGNEVSIQVTALKRIAKAARSNPRDLNAEWVRTRAEEALGE